MNCHTLFASRTPRHVWLLAGLALFMLSTFSSVEAGDIRAAGQVQFVDGSISILDSAGRARIAKVGMTVHEGDTVVTSSNAELHVETEDAGYIAVRPGTKLQFKVYRAEADGKDEAIIVLIKGTFRAVSGWIGKYNMQNYVIETPVATIGIRGTDHEPAFMPEITNSETLVGAPGAYDKVNSGTTYICNWAGTTILNAGRVGFASDDGSNLPVVLDRIPPFYRATRNEHLIDEKKGALDKRLHEKYRERAKESQSSTSPSSQNKDGQPQDHTGPGHPDHPDNPEPR